MSWSLVSWLISVRHPAQGPKTHSCAVMDLLSFAARKSRHPLVAACVCREFQLGIPIDNASEDVNTTIMSACLVCCQRWLDGTGSSLWHGCVWLFVVGNLSLDLTRVSYCILRGPGTNMSLSWRLGQAIFVCAKQKDAGLVCYCCSLRSNARVYGDDCWRMVSLVSGGPKPKRCAGPVCVVSFQRKKEVESPLRAPTQSKIWSQNTAVNTQRSDVWSDHVVRALLLRPSIVPTGIF